jgi:signal transduction histidine kinase
MDPQQSRPSPSNPGGPPVQPAEAPAAEAPAWRGGAGVLVLAALIAAGMAGNYFKYNLFYNADFIFGSIFAMLALQLFGLGRGLLAAFLISAPLVLIWGHPYAIVIMTAEVAVVGWLNGRLRIGLLQADALYWLLAGAPLVYGFYHVVMRVPTDGTLFIMGKDAVNGLANLLVARLIFTLVLHPARRSAISVREALYNLMALFVLGPTLVLLAVGGRSDFRDTDQKARAALRHDSEQMTLALANWAENRPASIRIGDPGLEPIRHQLEQSLGGNATFFTLVDRNGKVALTNRSDQRILEPFKQGQGRLVPLDSRISQWVPALPSHTPVMERWGKSFYVAESAAPGPSGWKLVLEQPVAPFQQALFTRYSEHLALLLLLLLVSLMVAELVSRRFAHSFEQLGALSSNLPLKLASGGAAIPWPETGIQESNQLIANFRIMAESLTKQFTKVRLANASLERRVLERTRELQEEHAEMERFTYMVSHDLKSPLVTIRTFLGYLDQDLAQGKAERAAKDMDFIRGAAGKMAQLLDGLLEVSRVGKGMNPPVPVTCADLVREALATVAGALSARDVAVTVEGPPVHLFGDRPRLEAIWQNLVDNAVKYMGDQPSPRIILDVEGLGGEMVFSVRDNGMGIDPRFHGKVFGLFEQLDPASEGTGLGLALVQRIVEYYGGRIWLESEGVGLGTCFRFTLPLALMNPTPGAQ